MAKSKKLTDTAADKDTHKGYNEKNPTEPQGAFKANSMEQPAKNVKETPRKNPA